MTALTIRTFDDKLKRELKIRAARNNRSMEAEAADILARELNKSPQRLNLHQRIRARLAKHGLDGIELDIPSRSSDNRDPPDFG